MKCTLLLMLITACLLLQSCGGTSKVADTYKPPYTQAEIEAKLSAAYKQKKGEAFRLFFADWNEKIQPQTEAFINRNDTIKAIYEVYKEFYTPHNLLRLGKWEWGNKLNEKSRYAAIQNTVYYNVSASVKPNTNNQKADSIVNFRPPLNISANSVVYLTPEYKKALVKFLGTESTEVGEGNIMNPSFARGESDKRLSALFPFLPILNGHWGGYWHIETHPLIGTMSFNKDLSQVVLTFRVGYQGGEATLVKLNGKWTIKQSGGTWIE